MSVVSSTYTLGHQQADGRRYVTERHTLHTGQVVVNEYGPVGTIDYDAHKAAKAAEIEEALAQAEFEAILGA